MLEKNPQDISFNDVQAFCAQKIPESRWLDYKKTYEGSPKHNANIAKIVSAMANAHGGWVLIGIDESSKDNLGRGIPSEKIDGIDIKIGAPERIKQICLDSIYPPILPDIGHCILDDNSSKEVVLIRVHESLYTPHEIQAGKVYIRKNDISQLVNDGTEASVSEIESLLRRRQGMDEKLEVLLAASYSRCSLNDKIPTIRISCIPRFPDEPLTDYQSLTSLSKAIFMKRLFKGHRKFQTVSDGLNSSFSREWFNRISNSAAKAEVSRYGVLHITASAKVQEGAPFCAIDGMEICEMFHNFLSAAKELYDLLKYDGLVTFRFHFITGQSECRMLEGSAEEPILDAMFSKDFTFLARRLGDKQIITEIVTEFLWSAGYGEKLLQTDYVSKLVESLG